MKKVIIISIVIFLMLATALFVYILDYNNNMSIQEEEYQKSIQQMKKEQGVKNEEFYNNQEEKNERISQIEESKKYHDQDGDGLTYAEELELGTDDYSLDSDGDGINDNEDSHPAGGGTTYKHTINWEHDEQQYTTQFGIPEDRYLYYKNKERGWCCEGWEDFATPYDLTIRTIADDISDVASLQGNNPTVVAIDFVESMIYQYDVEFNSNEEYPKYAIETIVDERGDCEDTSFLMASILEALNIDTILINLPGHMAVGVYCDGCSGTYYEYKNRKYYFLETTSSSGRWELGRTGYDMSEVQGVIDV